MTSRSKFEGTLCNRVMKLSGSGRLFWKPMYGILTSILKKLWIKEGRREEGNREIGGDNIVVGTL